MSNFQNSGCQGRGSGWRGVQFTPASGAPASFHCQAPARQRQAPTSLHCQAPAPAWQGLSLQAPAPAWQQAPAPAWQVLPLQLPVPSAHGDAASTVRASPGDVLVNRPGDVGNTPTRRLRVTTGSSRAFLGFRV